MLRAAVPFLLLAACTGQSVDQAAPDEATVYTYPTGDVVFHGADGRVLDVIEADARGRAIGPMESGGMVTYRLPRFAVQYETRGDVEPGDLIVSPELDNPPQAVVTTSPLTINLAPITDPTANLLIVHVACGDSYVEHAYSETLTSVSMDVPDSCLVDGSAFVYAYPRNNSAEPVAFATATTPVPGTLTLDRWRTDFASTPIAIDRDDSQLDRDLIFVTTNSTEVSLFPTDASVSLPVTTPPTGFFYDAFYTTNAELSVERRGMRNVPAIEISNDDLLPRITRLGLLATDDPHRPRVDYDATAPLGDALIEATLVGDFDWTISMRGPVRVPELPEWLEPVELEIFAVKATVTADDDGVRTTATSSLSLYD